MADKHLVTLPLGGGATVFIEAEPSLAPPAKAAKKGKKQLRAGKVAEKAGDIVRDAGEKVLDNLKAFATKCGQSFGDMEDPAPDEVSLEFGASVDLEGNIWVVKAKAQATLKISLKWQRRP